MSKVRNTLVGIGFATGRKSFQKVLRSYIYNLKESGLVDNQKIKLNLIVAYDLRYHNTRVGDYTRIHDDIAGQIDGITFIGSGAIKEDIDYLVSENVLQKNEARLVFGTGYAAKRNAVLYNAIKQRMDYLIFLDDDEYPLAVTNTRKTAIWGGQHVLTKHLQHIAEADLTHGYHCGYVSPIPFVEYNSTLTEQDFRTFIEAISNDILNWENIKCIMENGGVTYADTRVLTSETPVEVEKINRAKFISGANLGINLTDLWRVFPFYNPPGARGEDTFLSTCLSERRVLRVPCYTFHDGFSTYHHLLEGVLPIRLKFVRCDNEQVRDRFYRACIGWIRYKPLLLYITQPDQYEERIGEMREKLQGVLPKISRYFRYPEFANVLAELEKYHKNVQKHYAEFQAAKRVWARIMEHMDKVSCKINCPNIRK